MNSNSIPTNSKYVDIENNDKKKRLKEEIRSILNHQLYGILATSYNHQPYANLIAFVASKNIKYIFLATGKETQKFSNLNKNKNVAFFIDTRSNDRIDILNAFTLTGLGQARIVKTEQIEDIRKIYLLKHPLLDEFIHSKNVEIIELTISSYIFVKHFQQVFKLNLE